MSQSAEIESLLELSFAVGEGMELEPMLRRFLLDMRRLFSGVGGAILQLEPASPEFPETPPLLCAVPENLPRNPVYRAFWDLWSPAVLDEALTQQPDQLPLVSLHGDSALHAFRLPGFGVLIFLRGLASGALSDNCQRGLVPLMHKLAKAADACLAQARAHRETQRLTLAAKAAGIGVWEWDVTRGRLVWDAQTRALLGIASEESDARVEDWLERVHPDDVEDVRARIATCLREQDHCEFPFRIQPAEGEIRHLLAQAIVERNPLGDASRLTGVCRDVSERRTAANELQRARELAELANLAKSQFIANMNQELRSPMHAIMSMTELALDTDLTPTQRDFLKVVKSSSEVLSSIINDILDFARIDAGGLQVESIPFNLSVMIAETLKTLAARAGNKGLALVFDLTSDLPQQSLGDPGRIRQIVTNLCGNAIKFTETGEIRVRVESCPSSELDKDDILIAISDTGIGIAPDRLDTLFGTFAQADRSITRHYGGTALGLGLSSRLAELMGGRIWADSHPGQGSTFYLSLTLTRAEPPEAPLRPLQSWQNKRILIVDAHPINRRTLRYWFDQWGFEIQEAGTGLDAFELVRGSRDHGETFDVVLLASALPQMDGFELAARLMDEGLSEHGRIIMISSGGARGDAKRCRDLGISAFLTEPATPYELRDTLTRILDPDAAAAPPPLVTRHELNEQRQHLRILLIEDREISQKLAQTLLTKWGHEVTLATSGETALDLFKPGAFDLIFVDLDLPDMNGIATAQTIRASESVAQRTPIIAMTASTLDDNAAPDLASELDARVSKPIQPEVLEDIVERFALSRGGSD